MKTYPRRFYKAKNRTPFSMDCEYFEIFIEYPSQKKKICFYTVGNLPYGEKYIDEEYFEEDCENNYWEDDIAKPNNDLYLYDYDDFVTFSN